MLIPYALSKKYLVSATHNKHSVELIVVAAGEGICKIKVQFIRRN
jgi:hypothetical protein